MTRIAVTGGAGFIGTNLVNRLINEGIDVVVIDDLSTGLSSNLLGKKCEFHNISITDLKNLAPKILDCEVIFHLGARGSVPRSIKNPEATHFVNATGTLNVLEIAKKSGAHVIFSSSSSVYGRNSALPKIENMWLALKLLMQQASCLPNHTYKPTLTLLVFQLQFFDFLMYLDHFNARIMIMQLYYQNGFGWQ
jgi:nucleoside-diphosphate-sugar epimerase